MNLIDRMYYALCRTAYTFTHEEDGAVDIVAIVILIGIAVLLAVTFRDQINSLIRSLLGTIKENAPEAISE